MKRTITRSINPGSLSRAGSEVLAVCGGHRGMFLRGGMRGYDPRIGGSRLRHGSV